VEQHFLGVWKEAPHQPGNIVTDKGGLWYRWKATSTRPGESDDWQLMHKTHR
jgi:hypothetical protein